MLNAHEAKTPTAAAADTTLHKKLKTPTITSQGKNALAHCSNALSPIISWKLLSLPPWSANPLLHQSQQIKFVTLIISRRDRHHSLSKIGLISCRVCAPSSWLVDRSDSFCIKDGVRCHHDHHNKTSSVSTNRSNQQILTVHGYHVGFVHHVCVCVRHYATSILVSVITIHVKPSIRCSFSGLCCPVPFESAKACTVWAPDIAGCPFRYDNVCPVALEYMENPIKMYALWHHEDHFIYQHII